MTETTFTPNPKLDLVLEREIDVPVELVWKAWTTPEHLKKWFTPKPWETIDCEIDLRPGGEFRTVMRSPDKQEFSGSGCYLEIVENQKLVWTDALTKNYRPTGEGFFTGIILFEPIPSGTKYTAIAIHGNEENRTKHLEMGFLEGWGTALDQLVECIKNKQIA